MSHASEKSRETARKKPYVKPELISIELRQEEAVLGSCKTSDISGPSQSKCSDLGGCKTIGS